MADDALLLDLNNPVFQRDLFALEKADQLALLSTLKRLRGMTWRQVYADQGLKWETIHSRQGPHWATALQLPGQPRLPRRRLPGRAVVEDPQPPCGDHDSAYH